MKKVLCLLLAALSLTANPKAVVFDWGDVLSRPNKQIVIDFLCEELSLDPEEFDKINQERRNAQNEGRVQSAEEFWQKYALEKNIVLSKDWAKKYKDIIEKSMRKNEALYTLIAKLKEKKITVGLLSNIDSPYVKMIRDYGFYDPFDPCLLSCDTGMRKPDPKAYEHLLDTLQMPPEGVVFIDDKIENVEAAKKLGIDAVQYSSNEQILKELQKRGFDF
jgi:HAD superfamily hydrolase (TIGR01509 family)